MNKKLWVIVVVAAVAVVALWSGQNGVPEPLSLLDSQASASPTPAGTVQKTTTKTGSATNSGTIAVSASTADYTRLATEYNKMGRLIQFNERCQVTPPTVVLKKGSDVMLDNRSAVNKTVKLDSASYSLPGYTYRIVVPTTSRALPYEIGVDCVSSQGSTENGGTIRLQALIGQ